MARFTLRDLFWLTLVVALGVSLWIRDRQLKEARVIASIIKSCQEDLGRDYALLESQLEEFGLRVRMVIGIGKVIVRDSAPPDELNAQD